MFSSASTWIGAVGGFFGLVGILGGASAYFTKSRAENIIELQKEENGLLRQQNIDLRTEIKAADIQRQAALDKIAGLEKQLDFLQSMVTAQPQIQKLSEDVLNQHKEVLDQLKKLTAVFEKKAN